jgi:hypothetical protein
VLSESYFLIHVCLRVLIVPFYRSSSSLEDDDDDEMSVFVAVALMDDVFFHSFTIFLYTNIYMHII